ncbi:hypothetical protein CVS28_00020 [Arthrobacter glacialis]|nr:hypothetical protein CVS28_00020 [Arthrobacter glacialis]
MDSRARLAFAANPDAVVPGARTNNRASKAAMSLAVIPGVSAKVCPSSMMMPAWRKESSPASNAAIVPGWASSSTAWCASTAAERSGIHRVKAMSAHALEAATPDCHRSNATAVASTCAAPNTFATKAALQAAVASSKRFTTANAAIAASYTPRATPTLDSGSGPDTTEGTNAGNPTNTALSGPKDSMEGRTIPASNRATSCVASPPRSPGTITGILIPSEYAHRYHNAIASRTNILPILLSMVPGGTNG